MKHDYTPFVNDGTSRIKDEVIFRCFDEPWHSKDVDGATYGQGFGETP
jgi:hypothetical protein